MHWMLVNKQTLNTTHCDICSVFWMYAVQCVIYTVYCTVQCAVCSVQCTVTLAAPTQSGEDKRNTVFG